MLKEISKSLHHRLSTKSILLSLTSLLLFAFLLSKISLNEISESLEHTNSQILIKFSILILAGILIRATRYHFLFTYSKTIEQFWIVLKATSIRNLLMGFLPFRLGELVFVLFLKKQGVKLIDSSSIVGITWIFDLSALSVLIGGSLLISNFFSDSADLVLSSQVTTGITCIIIGLLLSYVLPFVRRIILRLYDLTPKDDKDTKSSSKRVDFYRHLNSLLRMAKEQSEVFLFRKITALFCLSLLLRITKYGALSLLFIEMSPDMQNILLASWWKLLLCFIIAEASTSIPGTTFLGFGAYELSFAYIFSNFILEVNGIESKIFSLHLVSQLVEFVVVSLIFVSARVRRKKPQTH